ncbi:GAF domain-containing protein [Streptobacillus moniliformis]|uniref:GAF domain-containing protein n=1 Tax=Streptobacillus moniliformis TaxID=34105 RepID=UPI0007E3D660|nr:GAF domain-containing protein [Streptobacillus moniliformis]
MNYELLYKELEALLSDEEFQISKMANMSAFIMQSIPDLNWVGFYIVYENVLKVGPFQGKPACSNIPKGRGVCGYTWENEKTTVVEDVHKFSGHIACDFASNSEVVIPIFDKNGNMIAELDIDSPKFNRFSKEDVKFLEKCVKLI